MNRSEDGPVGLALASRGDALTEPLLAALRDRLPGTRHLDVDLGPVQRLVVAACTWRPRRQAWAERYFKSRLGVRLRTRNAARVVGDRPGEVVLEVHALFDLSRRADVAVYVDCTHRQAAEQWPAWNPLRGRALRRWYADERAHYLRARHLFAYSRDTHRSLVEDYDVPAERVSIVAAGCNLHPDDVPGVDCRPTDARPGPPTVLFVGNDFERKGGPVLLRAFEQVRRAVPDARLVLVGVPPHVPAQDGVEVLGRLGDREALSALYGAAHVFCLPSLFEPYGLVLMEAMAHRLPVVATTTCGVPEVVVDGDTGRLVPPADEAALAAALVDLLRDPQRAAAMGQRGRERVDERFRWSHVVDRMLPVLGAVTAPRVIDLRDGPPVAATLTAADGAATA